MICSLREELWAWKDINGRRKQKEIIQLTIFWMCERKRIEGFLMELRMLIVLIFLKIDGSRPRFFVKGSFSAF